MSYRAGMDSAPRRRRGGRWDGEELVDRWRDEYRRGVREAFAWCLRELEDEASLERVRAELTRRGLA